MLQYKLGYGGSGRGTTFWETYARCGKKAMLDAEASEQKEMTSGGSVSTARGTIAHAFAEIYHGIRGAHFDPRDVEFTPEDHWALQMEGARAEAERVFNQYMDLIPPEGIGFVEGVEVALPPEDYPARDLSMLHGHIGIAPWTGKVDMITKLGDRHIETAERLSGRLLDPGRYLVDHKFLSRRNKNNHAKYSNSTQILTYIDAWNFIFPHKKVDGAIVNIVYCTKEVGIDWVIVKPPTEEQKRSLHNWFENVYQISQSKFGGFANRTECFNFGGTCRWLENGKCKGY